MVESVSTLQADHNFVIKQTKSQEAEIGALTKRIAALEGETKEQRAAKERLAAEKEFNQKFFQIQNNFNANEAEVYKQGAPSPLIPFSSQQRSTKGQPMPHTRWPCLFGSDVFTVWR